MTRKKQPGLDNSVSAIFFLLLAIFILLAGGMFLPFLRGVMRLFPIIGFLFLILGVVLVVITLKQRVKKPLGRWLILTGGSAIGFFAGAVLHNFFYALEVISESLPLISSLAGLIHALFFIIAVLVCPIGFIVGAIGVIYILLKKKAD